MSALPTAAEMLRRAFVLNRGRVAWTEKEWRDWLFTQFQFGDRRMSMSWAIDSEVDTGAWPRPDRVGDLLLDAATLLKPGAAEGRTSSIGAEREDWLRRAAEVLEAGPAAAAEQAFTASDVRALARVQRRLAFELREMRALLREAEDVVAEGATHACEGLQSDLLARQEAINALNGELYRAVAPLLSQERRS